MLYGLAQIPLNLNKGVSMKKLPPLDFEIPKEIQDHHSYQEGLALTNQLFKSALQERKKLTLKGIGKNIIDMWDRTDPQLVNEINIPNEIQEAYDAECKAAEAKQCDLQVKNRLAGKVQKDKDWLNVEGVKELIHKANTGALSKRNSADRIQKLTDAQGMTITSERIRKLLGHSE
jgi:hypothetical protein